MNIRKFTAALLYSAIIFSHPNAMAQDNTNEKAAAKTVSEVKPASLKPPIISSETFSAPGNMVNPKLSPNGQKMLYREQIQGKKYLTIKNVDSPDIMRLPEPDNADLGWYRWAGNDTILFGMNSVVFFFGEESRASSLYAFDLATKKYRPLGPKQRALNGDEVLYVEPNGQYLIQAIQPTVYEYPSVYRVRIEDNDIEQIVRSQKKIWRWIADEQGIVRMGMSYRTNGINIYYRKNDTENFNLISKLKDKDEDEEREDSLLDIAQIVSGSDEGYVLSNKETGRFALYKFDYLNRELGEMVFDHPENDIASYSLNDDGTALESVRFTDSRDRIFWFDPQMKKYQSQLEKAVPGQEVWIQSASKNKERMIIFTTSAVDPGSYFLFEPTARKLDRFGGINDPIDPKQMASTKYVEYPARDGLKIKSYLTLPKGREAKALPLIILPHGGPYGVRDTMDYNSEVQFLTNRGYAVLQPNYRGSDSYGESFYQAGEGQIGRAMQDDLDDGMDWLVKDGIVDPKRVCMVGASYGGYAALWSVIRNPDRYRCAASFAGVTDWNKQLKYDGKFFKSRYAREWKEKVRGEDDFDLDSVSPVHQIANLKRPVLLTHGDEDSNVPFSQYKMMVSAAEKAGVPLETKIYEGEGHGFSDRANEKDWLDRLEAFLKKHNPPDLTDITG